MSFGKPYSIFLKGNLKDNNGIISTHLPYIEMKSHLWQISLIDISYECLEAVNDLLKISTNIINDIHCENYREIFYNPNIGLIATKGRVGDKKCEHLNHNWLFINDFQENFQLFFRYFDFFAIEC